MYKVQKYLAYSALALLIYMPFHIFISQWVSTATGGLELWKIGKDVFTAGLTLIAVAAVFIMQKWTKLYLWLVGLAAVYAALHVLLFFATDQPFDTGLLATTYNLRLMCYAIIGYSGALLIRGQTSDVRRLNIRILLFVSTIVALIALLQWLLPKDIMAHFGYSIERGVKPNFFIDDKPDLPRVFSTLRDPNSLGAFLILPITLLAYSLARFWQTSRRLLLGGLLLLHGLILFLTFSRSAWLGTFVSLVLLFAWQYRKQAEIMIKKFWPILLFAFCYLLFAIFLLRDQYIVQNVVFHSDENTRLTDSNNLHLIQIQKGLDGIVEQPLGQGPGTAGLVSVHHPDGGLLTENYFVQIAYEVGVLGLAVLVAFMALIVRTLWQRKERALPLALLASFAGLTLMNMLLHTWANEAVAATWFLLAGFSLHATTQASKNHHKKA